MFASANVPVAEEAHRQHRRRGAQLPATNAGDRASAGDERADDLRARPPERVAADEAPDDAEQPGAREREPGRSSLPAGPWLSCSRRQRERDEHEADRHVQPEDPLPRDALDDRAADERAERDREAADAAPRAEREAAPLGRARPPRGSSASAA